MDIQALLESRIGQLPSGEHHDSLRAVKAHIDSAVRHLTRGRKDGDETLFTDAIYRCNQAFEGSIKEAYRVLAGKDPRKKPTVELENFLTAENILRQRVLDQLTSYRKAWRNPSVHDHMVDFDEAEALLAITSVTAFAIVLCDQIVGKLAFDRAAGARGSSGIFDPTLSLLDQAAEKLRLFAVSHGRREGSASLPPEAYSRLEGELAGYLAVSFSESCGLSVTQHQRLSGYEADIVVQHGSEKVAIELKSLRQPARARDLVQRAVAQAALLLRAPEVSGAAILIYVPNSGPYAIGPTPEVPDCPIKVVAPLVVTPQGFVASRAEPAPPFPADEAYRRTIGPARGPAVRRFPAQRRDPPGAR